MTATLHTLRAGAQPVVNPVIRGRPKGVILLSIARRQRVALDLQTRGYIARRTEIGNRIERVKGSIESSEAAIDRYYAVLASPQEMLAGLFLNQASREASNAAAQLVEDLKQLGELEAELRRLGPAR